MISIIIPVFNKPDNLRQCLDSVFAQTERDFEVIVVDDGSKDEVVIKQVVADFKIDQFIRQDNQGAPAARNAGFAISKGEYLLFLDSDAVMHPNMLFELKKALESHSEADFAYCSFQHGRILMQASEFAKNKLKQNNFIHTSSLIRRAVFPKFDESLSKFQDWDLWLTMTEAGSVGVAVPEVLFQIIDTDGTMSTWLPKFVYKLPWPIFGFTPQVLQKYFQAREVIKKKHNL